MLVNGVGPPGSVGEEFRTHLDALTELGRSATAHAVAEAEAAGVRTVEELIDDKPAQALIQAADKHDAQVIVVGTYGESPLRGAMLGSTPHKLLHRSQEPPPMIVSGLGAVAVHPQRSRSCSGAEASVSLPAGFMIVSARGAATVHLSRS